jgi:fatty-acyl-CoA synthase
MRPRTLAGLLRERAQSQPDQVALRLRERTGWTEWTWSRYWDAARSAQAGLRQAGVRPGHRVLLLALEVEPAVSCLFGLWALGAVPIPIGWPLQAHRREDFFKGLAETARLLGALFLIVPASVAETPLPGPARVVTLEEILAGGPDAALPDPDEARGAAFIQLTSGTTSRPRGAVVLHERLWLHLEAMSRALPSHSASVGVSWLPLHHDMGLVGGLLFPFYNGFVGHLISTADFQRQPSLWLESLSRFRATITAAPPSAYALCHSLAPRLLAAGVDLSALECAMVGAEPISAGLLRRFHAAFAPAGFRAEAFFPVYGLAEATVAVSFPDLLQPTCIDRVDRDALETEGRAVPVKAASGLELVGVGRAIPGTELRIAGEPGTTASERIVGEIQVRSATLMWGYWGERDATRSTVRDGWLRTGDLGYVAGGILFVTGRKKELIIKGGHNLIPSALEEIVQLVEDVRPAAVAAVGLRSASRDTELVCIAAETRLPLSRHPSLSARIRAALAARGVAVDRIVLVPPRTLPRTTSGKLQRLAIRRMIEDGESAAQWRVPAGLSA